MLKLARCCFIGLIVFSTVSCNRSEKEEKGKPANSVVPDPNKKGPAVEPKKEKVSDAELDKEPSAPSVEVLAVEEEKAKYEKAFRDYNEAVRLEPKNSKGYNARAWLWATCPDSRYRDGKKAVESAKQALDLDPKSANSMDTLAAAHAENGDFAEAVRWQEKALADPSVKNNADFRHRLELYRDKKPYRQQGIWQQARLKITTDARFTVDANFEVWRDGKSIGHSMVTNSFFRIGTGEVTISLQLLDLPDTPLNKDKRQLRMTSECRGISNTTSNQMSNLEVPKGLPSEGSVQKQIAVARDGNFVVWAWTAGKQIESKKPNETVEEAARRSEWAMVVIVSIKRRQDSHRITLTPPQKVLIPSATMVFVGPSFKKALEDWKDVAVVDPTGPFGHMKANAEQILAEKIKVDAKNPKLGSAEFVIEKWRIAPPVENSVVGTETLTLERSAADSNDWVLTAEARERIKKLVGAP